MTCSGGIRRRRDWGLGAEALGLGWELGAGAQGSGLRTIIAAMTQRFLSLLTFTFSLLTFSVSVSAFAQDTPTEKEAARDVLKKMAALEQSLDVPALVTRLTGAERRPRSGGRARQGADGQGAADAGRRHRDASRDRLRGEAVGQQAHRLPAAAQLQHRDRHRRPVDRVRRQVQGQQRQPGARHHPRIRRAARHQGRVPRRSAQRAGSGRHGGGDRDGRVPRRAPRRPAASSSTARRARR